MEKEQGMWNLLQSDSSDREKIHTGSRTFVQDVWLRFRKKKSALVGLIIIVVLLFFSIVGPFLTPHDYYTQNLDYVNIPPFFQAHPASDGGYYYLTGNLKVLKVSSDGTFGKPLTRIKDNASKKLITYDDNGEVVSVSYKKKPAALLDANGERLTDGGVRLHNKIYPLGTDGLGRDMLARLMFGARISLLVAFIAAAVNLVIGVLYGGISAYCGGKVDAVMMRIVEIISTIPLMLYVILLMVWFGQGLRSIIIALSTVYWVDMARVVRGQILSLKEQEFVYAAKTIGSSPWQILLRHLIPNAMGPILVTVTMLIPSAIFMEAFLGFIGLGLPAPMASLGTMCNDAIEALRVTPYQMFLPALTICIAMFAFNFVGDGLRDALDPKLKK